MLLLKKTFIVHTKDFLFFCENEVSSIFFFYARVKDRYVCTFDY